MSLALVSASLKFIHHPDTAEWKIKRRLLFGVRLNTWLAFNSIPLEVEPHATQQQSKQRRP